MFLYWMPTWIYLRVSAVWLPFPLTSCSRCFCFYYEEWTPWAGAASATFCVVRGSLDNLRVAQGAKRRPPSPSHRFVCGCTDVQRIDVLSESAESPTGGNSLPVVIPKIFFFRSYSAAWIWIRECVYYFGRDFFVHQRSYWPGSRRRRDTFESG